MDWKIGKTLHFSKELRGVEARSQRSSRGAGARKSFTGFTGQAGGFPDGTHLHLILNSTKASLEEMVLSVANCQLSSFVWFFQVQVMQGQSRLQHFHWFIIGHNSLFGSGGFWRYCIWPGSRIPLKLTRKDPKNGPCWSNNDFWRSGSEYFWKLFWKLFIPTRLPSRIQF